MSSRSKALVLFAALAMTIHAASAQERRPHNVIFFVPDGLRALSVTPQTAPTMAAVRDKGVNFRNSHSLFPTFTTANASAFATGHYLGDTGDFSNTIYTAKPMATLGGTVTPFLETDALLGELDQHFDGDYLNEETLLKAARKRGFSTAAIGKLGPTLIFDHTERSGQQTIIFDDSTGSANGIPLSDEIKAALTAAGLPLATPPRGDNGNIGDFKTPGTLVANVVQQNYLADVATKVVLPMFKNRGKPFVLVYWSRDPDGTQHGQGDSLQSVTPGINGPTSFAAIKNADDNLRRLQQTLKDLGLAETTNIVIAADHGFSTVSKESKTSFAAKATYADVKEGMLPPGFLAIDLARDLALPLFDPDNKNAAVMTMADGQARFGDGTIGATHTRNGNGLLGADPLKPDVVVAANGGSDLVYLPNHDAKLAGRIVTALLAEDYVSGVFVDDDLGRFPGTLPLSAINLRGAAVTPHPAIVVNFRSFSTGCAQPVMCTVVVADTRFQQGQGMHGSFSRGETMNFMAAIGPDFKSGFVDRAPASNADIGKTLAHLLDLKIANKGKLIGRVLHEAMPNGAIARAIKGRLTSPPGAGGLRTMLIYQRVGATRYFDAAGFPGRTVGLPEGENATR